MAERLTAWLYGTPVMTLAHADNFAIDFEWAKEGVERSGLGRRALSISLPLGAPIRARGVRVLDFFSNFLPDSPVLLAMTQLAGVSPLTPPDVSCVVAKRAVEVALGGANALVLARKD